MPVYDDLFIRDALDDAGTIPSGAATAYLSPDIVVWGTQTIEHPQEFLVSNYDTAWYRNVVVDEKNYIYCRATNLYELPAQGRLYLYYVPGGVLSDIGVWRNNRIGTAIPGQDYLALDARRPGAVVVGDTAFEWVPVQTGHFCFIAQITTERHPNPLPESFASTDAYFRWVLDNPSVGWLNVTVLDNASPPHYQQDFGFQNLDDFEREYIFVMDSANLPRGSTMSMVCAAAAPRPPINIAGTIGEMPGEILTCFSWLPGHFAAALTATVELPADAAWSGDMEVGIEVYGIVQPEDSDDLKSFARPIGELGLDGGRQARSASAAVRLGRFTVQTMTEARLPARRGGPGSGQLYP